MDSRIELKMSLEKFRAEEKYLEFFWMGALKAYYLGINFMEINESARKEIAHFSESGEAKRLNRYLEFPQITPYFLENISAGIWAVPSNITDAVSARLHKEWPSSGQIIRTCPADTIYVKAQKILADALQKIPDDQQGISLLSGLEMIRAPFEYLNTARLYAVDMCYLDKLKCLKADRFESELKGIFDSSCPDRTYHRYIDEICESESRSHSGYASNGLVLGDVNEGEMLIENIYSGLKTKRKAEFDSGKIVPVVGNAQNLSDTKKITISEGQIATEPLSFEDGSLDYAVVSGVEWLIGDWKRGLQEAVRTLKPCSRMIVSSYDPIALKLPLDGRWGLLGRMKDWIVLEPPNIKDIELFLKENDFDTNLNSVRDHYNCIEAVRKI